MRIFEPILWWFRSEKKDKEYTEKLVNLVMNEVEDWVLSRDCVKAEDRDIENLKYRLLSRFERC